MLAQLFLNLLLQTDMFLLSRFVGEAGGVLGLPVKESDVLVGAYGMAQLFAFLPYQMLISISFVLFPMLARAHSEEDSAAIARYTATGVRIALVIAGLMCGTVAALGPHVIRFAFSEAAAMRGGEALRVLALGMGAFAVLGIVSAALTSLKREGLAALLTAATVIAVAVGSVLLVPNAPFGPAMLMRSATAVALAMGLAAVVGGLVLRKISGAFTSPLTIVRVLAATAITLAVGSRLPWLGKLMVIPEAIGLGLLYLAILALLREIGGADLATLRQAFGRRQPR
jgi:stage V sporulation protein B